MYIIKLDAIDSTNSYLKEMTNAGWPKDYTVVVTDHQTNGRGQMGTIWQAEMGKNLTASIFKEIKFLKIDQQFYISMAIALAIYESLKTFRIPQLSIKWPNDILSADKKLCGILIENVIKNNRLKGTIMGFGLNINQKEFNNLPQASSMSNITGVVFRKDEVLADILNRLRSYFDLLNDNQLTRIQLQYEDILFRNGKPSTFKQLDETTFTGIIRGVTNQGQLKVWTEDDIVKTFDLKEVSLLY